jgi:hypothetical protein
MDATVKMAGKSARLVVGSELISFLIQKKTTVPDTIAETPHCRSQISRIVAPIVKTLVAQCDIRHYALAIRNFERDEAGPHLGYFRRKAMGIA